MSVTDSELRILEEGIESVYIEEKMSVNSEALKKVGIFSKSFTTGITANVNDEVGYDKTVNWLKLQCRNRNQREYDECIKGYTKQGLK